MYRLNNGVAAGNPHCQTVPQVTAIPVSHRDQAEQSSLLALGSITSVNRKHAEEETPTTEAELTKIQELTEIIS